MTRSTLASMVGAYAGKLIVCRSAGDLRDLERRLVAEERALEKT